MPRGSMQATLQVGGMTISLAASKEAEGQIGQAFPLPAGKSGTISAAAGVDGLPNGHGFVHDDPVAVHWTVAGVRKCRYGLLVDVAGANSVTFQENHGAGDALPAEDTPVVLSKEVSAAMPFAGDSARVVAVGANKDTHAQFYEDGSANDLHLVLEAGAGWFWIMGLYTNPLAGRTPTALRASNATTEAATVTVGLTYDSVT